jgi:hypothetical protein
MTRLGVTVAVMALLSGMMLAVTTSSGAAGGLTSLTLTSVEPDGTPAVGPSAQAAIAADGEYAAFVSPAGAADDAVYRRDLVTGTTTLVSDTTGGAATAPDISANGRLMSYEQDGDVFVAVYRPGGLTLHQVTGNSEDPPYARVVTCPASFGAGRVTPCGPRLSADGTTLVYPAELTPASPELSITASAGDGGNQVPMRGDTLDLTPSSAGEVTYANEAASAVPFTGVTITEPPGFPAGQPFSIGHTTCAGALRAGGSCTTSVSFWRGACATIANDGPRLITGSLVTNSPDRDGQSVIELTALCDQVGLSSATHHAGVAATASADQTGCPAPPSDLPLTPAPATTSDVQGAPVSDIGAAEADRPYVVWMTVSAPATDDGTAAVAFAAANGDDCGIRLVNPAALKLADPLPAAAPSPCGQGEQLTGPLPAPSPSSSMSPSGVPSTRPPELTSMTSGAPPECTAYLLINPAAATVDAAFLGMESGSGVIPTAYLTVQGVRHLILARRAVAGSGDFASSSVTVVSVASDGAELPDAAEPAVSANGQYVGFAAPVPGQQTTAEASEVWLHEVGWSAGSVVRPGRTTLVSCLPHRPGSCPAAPNADSPSLSASGQQVAFATTAAVLPSNGFQPTSPATADSPDKVYVRSVGAGTSVLVSAGGDAPSYAPAISQDATAVAFVSRADGRANLYLSTVGRGGTEIVAAPGFPSGTSVGLPSVDAIGRLTTFPAIGALLPSAPKGSTSVYTFSRLPRLSPTPADTTFGQVLVDSGTRHGGITVTDTGPGPGTVTAVTVSGPFRVTGCLDMLLTSGSRCTVTVAFVPSAPGRETAKLTVTTEDDGEPPISVTVPIAADVPTPRLSVSPDVATYGEAVQVTGTGFPPGWSMTLTWTIGLGSATTRVSRLGTVRATMVVFPDDILGPRTLVAASSARTTGVLAQAPLLVQQPSQEPPFSSGPPP